MTGPDPQALGEALVAALEDLLRHDPGDVELNPLTGRLASPTAVGGHFARAALDALSVGERPAPGLVEAARDWRIDAWEPVVVAARDARHLLRGGQADEAHEMLGAALDRLDGLPPKETP